MADFLPVFKVFDLATGQINQFHGKYELKIVGGGPTYQSITDYSQEEQTKYNYQTTRYILKYLIFARSRKLSIAASLLPQFVKRQGIYHYLLRWALYSQKVFPFFGKIILLVPLNEAPSRGSGSNASLKSV